MQTVWIQCNTCMHTHVCFLFFGLFVCFKQMYYVKCILGELVDRVRTFFIASKMCISLHKPREWGSGIKEKYFI